jgi:hypothetical protein
VRCPTPVPFLLLELGLFVMPGASQVCLCGLAPLEACFTGGLLHWRLASLETTAQKLRLCGYRTLSAMILSYTTPPLSFSRPLPHYLLQSRVPHATTARHKLYYLELWCAYCKLSHLLVSSLTCKLALRGSSLLSALVYYINCAS